MHEWTSLFLIQVSSSLLSEHQLAGRLLALLELHAIVHLIELREVMGVVVFASFFDRLEGHVIIINSCHSLRVAVLLLLGIF